VQSKGGGIRGRIKIVFNDHCQAEFDPSGPQRDAIDMPSRIRMHIKVYMRVEKIEMALTQVWCDHCGIRGSIAHLLYGLPRW